MGLSRREFLATGGLLLAGCAGSRGAAQTATGGTVRAEPLMRIGLALAQPGTRFEAVGGRYLIHEKAADDPIAVAAAGETWGVAPEADGGARVVDPRGYLSRAHSRPIRVEALEPGSSLRIGEHRYAGVFEVISRSGGLTLVNELPLEEYLRAVLPREMPKRDGGMEALKVQAVASRSYALKRMGSRSDLGFDLFGDVQDQVYGGVDDVTAESDRALAETRGRALLSGDLLVDALYHSTCGGATAAVEEAFPLPAAPYLVSIDDADGKGRFYCAGSRYFRWQASYDREQLGKLFARNLGRFASLPAAGLGELTDLSVAGTSPGGRVLALRIETSTGSYQVARNDVRWIFADESSPGLRSTLFLLRKQRGRGGVDSITLTGGGWGHGVGMCQMGALGRAVGGAGHEEILAQYYRGARVERLYA